MMRLSTLALAILTVAACSNTIDNAGGDGGHGSGSGSGSGHGGVDAQPGVGEPANLAGMTLYHNQVRAGVDTPTPLPALQWDPALASYAATWAAKCQSADGRLLDHDPARTNVAGYPNIGENIFAAGGQTAGAKQAVDDWAAEASDYTYATNACTGVCGHYTQIVWRATTHVGCALQNCPGLAFPSTIVCDYGPAGNVGNEKPY